MSFPPGMLRPRITPATYPLQIELIPEKAWGNNLRSVLTRGQWDTIKRAVYERAGHVCEICGERGGRHPVECHERWRFREAERQQILMGLEALCPACHRCKHLGLAEKLGRMDESMERIMRINGMSQPQMAEYLRWAWGQQKRMATFVWHLDLTWLEQRKDELNGGAPLRLSSAGLEKTSAQI